ncbi:MAG: OmpA family protein [Bacteroidota bacterium]
MKKSNYFIFMLLICVHSYAQQKTSNTPNSRDTKTTTTSKSVAEKTLAKPTITTLNQIDDLNNIELSRWSFGAQLGPAVTLFDVDQDGINFGYGGYAKYSFSPVFGLRANIITGLLTGSTLPSKNSYDNLLTTVSIQTIWNLGTINFRQRHPRSNLYGLLGLGIALPDVRVINSGVDKGNYTKGSKYTTPLVTLPVGLGYKYKLNDDFDIGFEGNLYICKNDALDGYTPDPNSYSDFYSYYLFNLTYNVTKGGTQQHADWYNPIAKMYDDMSKMSKEAMTELKKDGDFDGVPDMLDIEQNTKEGYKVDIKGKTLDSDNDGVPDTEDSDPYGFMQAMKVYYPSENFKADKKIKTYRFDDSIPHDEFTEFDDATVGLPIITFAPNKYDVHVEHYPLLNSIARIMQADTGVSLVIIGHADNNKPDMTQITIAEKRALAVKRQLMKIYEIEDRRLLIFSIRDPFVKKYKLKTEGLDRKAEFRLIRLND